jgi:hypothetical protein
MPQIPGRVLHDSIVSTSRRQLEITCMFCPRCRTEYRPGFTMCADCGLTLVAELPPELSTGPEPALNLVTVFESSNIPEFTLARTILEDAGIEYVIGNAGEGAFWGHTARSIKVSEQDAAGARALMEQINQGSSIQDEIEFEGGEDFSDRDPY